MVKKSTPPDEDDAQLFRQALAKVTPLPPSNRVDVGNRADVGNRPDVSNRAHVAVPPFYPAQRTTKSTDIKNHLSDFGAGDSTLAEFMRSGISRMELRKLRRAKIQDSLDLHGLTSEQAQKLLLEFLHEASANNLRYVCIIHGKGWHTAGREGVLKNRSRHWLTQCAEVLAFCEAPPNEGGAGAVKVLLKKN